ncbi:ABC transporter permease [Frankia nepalensis]|uniref:ABC transporter permease n=1 Tax=Frankia nepalensis TaxID=1836974 RepID=UPI001933E12A|nr:ABC transporter permease [Frankia nepalensis]
MWSPRSARCSPSRASRSSSRRASRSLSGWISGAGGSRGGGAARRGGGGGGAGGGGGRTAAHFLWFGTAKVLSIPVAVLVMIVIAAVVIVFLTYSRWGRALYAIGGNPVAARLAGIPVNRYRALAYVISGLCAACAGILLSARLGRGDVGAGDVYLLQAVAATLIGFAVLGANRPNPFGTLVGAVFLGVLINGLTMLNVPYYTQTFVQGALLVAALLLSYAVAPRSRRAS